jgi:GDP-mannose 6-dehydrogenase
MKIVVFGLDYVGATVTACLLRDGHTVIGVDVRSDKASKIESGVSPVSEPGLDELLAAGRDAGRLSAVTDIGNYLDDADIAMICVGTPSLPGGGLDLTQFCAVSAELGTALKTRDSARKSLIVAYRSTIFPGPRPAQARQCRARPVRRRCRPVCAAHRYRGRAVHAGVQRRAPDLYERSRDHLVR